MAQEENPLAFPKKADKTRLDLYDHYDKLYRGDHFTAFRIKTDKDFGNWYARLRYVVGNFAGLASRVMADMLFGESITVATSTPLNQDFIDGVMENNQFLAQLYESALVNSSEGDDVFKIRIGRRNPALPDTAPEIIIEQIGPKIYFPQFDNQSARNTANQDVLNVVFKQAGVTYLHREIHTAGKIMHEVYKYDPNARLIIPPALDNATFGFVDEEDTGVERSLIFHIPNVRDGSGYFGTSDYADLDSLLFALNNRVTKTDNILDKHSDPILAVPPGVIDDQGNVKKEALGMFEVDNEQGTGFNKPEYIVWNANLDVAFKEIDKLTEFLFMFSEIAPATMGADKNGQIESGRALRFKLLATIRKRNRKIRYYDQAIKDMLYTAQQISIVHNIAVNGLKPLSAERPTIDWGTGVIPDPTELIDSAVKRIDAGISSRADAIASLDNKTPDEARDKVEEIDKENTASVPAVSNGTSGAVPPAPGDAPANNPNDPTAVKPVKAPLGAVKPVKPVRP